MGPEDTEERDDPVGEVYVPRDDAPVQEAHEDGVTVVDFDPDPPGAPPTPEFYQSETQIEEASSAEENDAQDDGGGDS